MAWANQGDTYNNFDMDSSDGTNAKKLIVRNAAATPSGNFRAEIIETGGTQEALKVDGKIRVVKTSGSEQRCGTIASLLFS